MAVKHQSKIVYIHTIKGLDGLFDDLTRKFIPEAKAFHIIDETLIYTALSEGKATPYIYRRVTEHAVSAVEFGANVIQLTCSSISETADLVGLSVTVPLLKIDEPMVREAVNKYRTIGIIATAPTTLNPTLRLVAGEADAAGKDVKAVPVLCEGAYSAYLQGDKDRHDRIVKKHLLELMEEVDVILLAQVSIARIVETLKEGEVRVPVLSSPEPAVRHIAEVLKGGNSV
ncbi:MAG: Asp/Glu/hydantoin racemase [Spirochaetes bacterium]|nr:MAG: Asp/Glu/hydantoin racemase [Spirochaetota bacterium]